MDTAGNGSPDSRAPPGSAAPSLNGPQSPYLTLPCVAQLVPAARDDAEPTKLPIVAIPNGLPTRYKGLSWAGKGSKTLTARHCGHRIGSGEQFKHGKTSAKKTQAEWKQVRLAARARGARPPRWRTRCFFF